MPISIRLLMVCAPDFAISLKLRVKRRARPAAADDERERLRRALSSRLTRHLVRDVLPD